MQRWFIAVFCLHFFLSIGLFAFGKIELPSAQAHDTAHSEPSFALVSDEPRQNQDLLAEAHDHGLTDSQPDLPDGMKPVGWTTPRRCERPHISAPTRLGTPSPDLAGLLRPPQAT